MKGGFRMLEKRIMLLVSQKCNLNCVYCYEHHKNNADMSLSLAKKILDSELGKYEDRYEEPIIIELFGGEAFENFSLIKDIVEYISEKYSNLRIFYETTTNGTLIHGDIKRWLRNNREKFLISLSLDGTQEMHDKNRMFYNNIGSFKYIDINFFAETWPGCPAKMTVSKSTLPSLADGIKFLEHYGFKCDATISIGVDWSQKEDLKILSRELMKLVKYYSEDISKNLCTMLNFDFRLLFSSLDEDYRFCGAGLELICFDTEGNKYPCQGFAPISIGSRAADYKNFDERKFRFNEENMCKNCKFIKLCPNCYAANLQSTGNMQKVDKNLCSIYKICILASAKIQFNRIVSKKKFDKNDQLILKGISIIQNELGDIYDTCL